MNTRNLFVIATVIIAVIGAGLFFTGEEQKSKEDDFTVRGSATTTPSVIEIAKKMTGRDFLKEGTLKPGQVEPSDVYTNEFNPYFKECEGKK